MLSILIPVYNFDVTQLVESLSKQAQTEKINYEILVIDDASRKEFKEINRSIRNLPHIRYFELKENHGRAKIRNKLAKFAHYDNLLFIDCDSQITGNDYIKKYIQYCNGKKVVICGGLKYTEAAPNEDDYYLRWKYGNEREDKPAKIRSKKPNTSFSSFNFLISKSIISNIKFNEQIKGYGHEDTLFGYELKKENITIKHIDNPLIHVGLETGEEFLRKTRESIKNLKRIMKINGNEKRLVKDIALLSFYKFIGKIGLEKFVHYIFRKNEYRLRKNLLSKNPNLRVFDLYKLGYLCSINGGQS